ncbi:VWA domain-containing protein [Gilliamella bombi]|uniref:VWA domain-containing protein n=1 Tax=Gilliamella bombi TaxID=1908521 RepID=UPI00117A38B9|nr:VWA domain-containing protein [Gilliamella bombi]
MLVSINHTQTMRDRARISEATNEASLAVIALNNKNADKTAIEQNRKMALNYINYFVYQKISDDLVEDADASINIEYNKNTKVYSIAYKQKVDSLTSSKDKGKVGELNQSMIVSNKTESYGNTKKFDRYDSFDIAFISDFSGSATCQYGDTGCNDYSPQNGNSDQQRLQYMKQAITDIINKLKESSGIKFALIPYDIGVPVKLEAKNLAGGESYGCSVMYKMQGPYYDKINYNFWANKNIAYSKWINYSKSYNESKLPPTYFIENLPYMYFPHKNDVTYYLDYFNYRYYSQIIGPAKGLYDDDALVRERLCKPVLNDEGAARYRCGEDNWDYPLRHEHKKTINEQYGAIVQLYHFMFSGEYSDVHYSFANTKTVDVQGTIDELFSGINTNIITFNRPISPTVGDFSPFLGMCQSPLYNNDIMSEKVINLPTNHQRFLEASKHIRTFKAFPHLVPFSKDRNHNSTLLSYIGESEQSWQPGGGTDTITALLRTVPVMANGSANNKMMIIITDGKDDAGADILRDDFLDKGVCQAITTGLTSADNENKGYIEKAANTATIHYIKLDPKAANLTTDEQYEEVYGKWFTKCMNGNREYLHEAQDYQSLFDTMAKIIQTETGNFVNRDESN